MKEFYCVRHHLFCFTIQGYHMGNCGENTAKNLGISREEQDAYGMESYRRSAEAYANNQIQPEIFEVSVPQKRGKAPPLIVKEDEEFKKINFDKFSKLPTVFQRDGGTVTAGNASTLSDGAAAVVLMSEDQANSKGCKPIAR